MMVSVKWLTKTIGGEIGQMQWEEKEIGFFSVMLLSGRGSNCQSILAGSCSESPGLPRGVTHETYTGSTLPTSAAQCEM